MDRFLIAGFLIALAFISQPKAQTTTCGESLEGSADSIGARLSKIEVALEQQRIILEQVQHQTEGGMIPLVR